MVDVVSGAKTMLERRGYTCVKVQPYDESVPCTWLHARDVRCAVLETSLNKQVATELLQSMAGSGTYIFIVANLTSQAKEVLTQTEVRVEFLQPSDVAFNKMEHQYVPRYRVLTEEEVLALEKKYFATRDKFPVILESDPVCRYMGFRPGQVLEITRKTLAAEVSYRTVK